MRLTQIKLAGFKSFVEPTQLMLPSQLVGIVGPNGCGKSNVIDAVRWVLGESKAGELRGETMQDVIFNGSSDRRPGSRASVELVFDNQLNTLTGQWGQFAELSVKRVITRDGGSTYSINNQVVRRRDIQDLFLGTGLGPNAYAIIGQGMISRIIEAKPEELRVYLEEAAGTSRYRERRRETENRLFEARENLVRVADLQSELLDRLVILEQQAAVAVQYRAVESDLLLSRRLLAFSRHQESQKDQYQYAQQSQQLEQNLIEAQVKVSHISAELEQMRLKLDCANQEMSQKQAALYEVSAQVGQIETELRLQSASRQTLLDRSARLKQQIEKLEQELAQVRVQQAEVDGQLPETIQKHNALKQRLFEAQQDLPQLEAAHQQTRRAVDASREGVAGQRQQLQVMATESRQMERELAQLQERRNQLEQDQQHYSPEQEANLKHQLDELSQSIHQWQAQEQTQQQSIAQYQQQESNFELSRKQIDVQIQQQHSALTQTQSRLSVLRQLQAAFEAPAAMKNWLKQQGLDELKPLWQSMRVARGWGACVEAVLRERVAAVSAGDLARLAAFEGMVPPQRFSFFQKQTQPVTNVKQENQVPAHWRALSSFVSGDDSVLAVIQEWLTGVWVLYEQQAGQPADLSVMLREQAVLKQLPSGHCLMSSSGHVLTAHSLNLLPKQSPEVSLLTRQDEIEVLSQRLGEQEQVLSQSRRELQTIQEQLAQLKQTMREALEQQQRNVKQRHEAQLKRVKLEEELQRYRQRLTQLQTDLNQVLPNIGVLTNKIATHQSAFERLDLGLAELQQKLEAQKLAEEAALKQLSFARSVVGQLENQTKDAQFAGERLSSRQQELLRFATHKQTQYEEQTFELEQQQQALLALTDEQTRASLQAALAGKQAADQVLAKARAATEICTKQLKEKELLWNTAQTGLEPLRRQWADAQLKEQAARLALTQFDEELQSLDTSVALMNQWLSEQIHKEPDFVLVKASSLQSKISRLKAQIDDLGPVNLMALQELNTQQERKLFLETQVDDLKNAANTLEEAIRKIDQETRERLMTTFNAVNQSFSELFPRLFGGGRAQLSLNDNDILSAGVHVMAQPPGKRNSSIFLLSGGEKALTATALVFAFFRLNPAPFCLLDEVDAPLDDVNTMRYCELVKSMARETQFIFISHNKIAMEMAHQLIGVTMHEQGVSRIVSVDLAAAVQLAI